MENIHLAGFECFASKFKTLDLWSLKYKNSMKQIELYGWEIGMKNKFIY
jgi:hypothetical protein